VLCCGADKKGERARAARSMRGDVWTGLQTVTRMGSTEWP